MQNVSQWMVIEDTVPQTVHKAEEEEDEEEDSIIIFTTTNAEFSQRRSVIFNLLIWWFRDIFTRVRTTPHYSRLWSVKPDNNSNGHDDIHTGLHRSSSSPACCLVVVFFWVAPETRLTNGTRNCLRAKIIHAPLYAFATDYLLLFCSRTTTEQAGHGSEGRHRKRNSSKFSGSRM